MQRHATWKLLNNVFPTTWAPQSPFFRILGNLDLISGGWARRENLESIIDIFGWNWAVIANVKNENCKPWPTLPRFSTTPEERASTCYGSSKLFSYSRDQKIRFSTYQSQASDVGGIIEVPLAQTGEGIADCELLTWFVKEGDEVEEFQPLCSVQSDKATVQITSRYKGKVSRVNFMPGDVVKVGESLLELIAGSSEAINIAHAPLLEDILDAREMDQSMSHAASKDPMEKTKSKVLVTPAVRHLAQGYGINLEDIPGSGKDGRILKEDVLKYITNKEGLNEELLTLSEIAPKPEFVTGTKEDELPCHLFPIQREAEGAMSVHRRMEGDLPEDKIIHVRGYQRIMVKTMTAAASIPHFHLVDDLNVDALVALKNSLKDIFMKQGIKLTYMPFIIKALSVALYKYPLVNSTFNEEASEICCRGAHNVGVAIATSHGLTVPNIKNVQHLSVLEIAKDLSRLTQLATANQLSSEDVSGGTITVSNFGSVGGKFGSPLLNLPQVAIVAIGRIQKLPRFSDDGSIYPASIMNVTWGADHRVLDGATLANVCNELKTLVEQTERLVMHLR